MKQVTLIHVVFIIRGDIHVGTQVNLLKRIDSFKLASSKLLITSNNNKIFNKWNISF